MAMATQEHGGKLFANGTRLGGLLKFPVGKSLKDDTARGRVLSSWNKAYGGAANAGKTALLEDGLEWQAMGMTSEDAQFIETMQWSIADISRIFDGIPVHMLSELSRATFTNIEHQGIGFVTYTIRPGAIRREEAMERDLLFGRSAKTHCIMYDLDGLMRGDSAARAVYYGAMVDKGILTRNEARVEDGWNPSSEPNMNTFTTQLNMTTIDKLGMGAPAVIDKPVSTDKPLATDTEE